MHTRAEKLLASALELPESDRAAIAAELIASLDPETDAGAAEAWDREIARRLAELDSGQVKTVPWEEVRQRLARGEHAIGSD